MYNGRVGSFVSLGKSFPDSRTLLTATEPVVAQSQMYNGRVLFHLGVSLDTFPLCKGPCRGTLMAANWAR
jgi:hypothetical protein